MTREPFRLTFQLSSGQKLLVTPVLVTQSDCFQGPQLCPAPKVTPPEGWARCSPGPQTASPLRAQPPAWPGRHRSRCSGQRSHIGAVTP